MRRIDRTKPFRRDFKRIGSTPEHEGSGVALQEVLDRLAADLPLPEKHRDHALRGNWAGHRECHVKPGEDGRHLAFGAACVSQRAFLKSSCRFIRLGEQVLLNSFGENALSKHLLCLSEFE